MVGCQVFPVHPMLTISNLDIPWACTFHEVVSFKAPQTLTDSVASTAEATKTTHEIRIRMSGTICKSTNGSRMITCGRLASKMTNSGVKLITTWTIT